MDFPDDIIITIDDDIIYKPRLIQRLIRWHKKYPDAIIAHRAVHVKTKNGRNAGCGRLLPYKKWKLFKRLRWFYNDGLRPSFATMATSGGGTLFPPHCLHKDVLRDDIFMKIAQTTDDIWGWTQALRAGTKTIPIFRGYWKITETARGKGPELRSENVRGGGNNRAIAEIEKMYPEIVEKVKG